MEDEEPDHYDSSPSSTPVGGPLVLVLGIDDGDDQVADTHSFSLSVNVEMQERVQAHR